jgi:putative aminopeptidase FrvX
MYDILKTLCELPGPVGREKVVHEFLLQRWAPHCHDAYLTPVGNLVAHVGGRGPKLLLLGHGDEIGFTIKHISEDGYLFIASGQRLAPDRPPMRGSYALPIGQPALVITRSGSNVEGVFATLTGHILSQRQRENIELEWNDMWVDVCAGSRSEAEGLGIRVGDRVIWNPPTRRRGEHVYGKALDNRAGLAVMDSVLQRIESDSLAYDLYLASSVQEEIGLIGAHSINRGIGAEYAIALDIGLSSDVPGVDQRDVSVQLGAGPTLIHKDFYAYSADVNDRIIATAEESDIPLQHAVFGIFGSDSGALLREGVAASLIGIPTRYTHSPFEMLHLDDMAWTAQLLHAFLERQPALGTEQP